MKYLKIFIFTVLFSCLFVMGINHLVNAIEFVGSVYEKHDYDNMDEDFFNVPFSSFNTRLNYLEASVDTGTVTVDTISTNWGTATKTGNTYALAFDSSTFALKSEVSPATGTLKTRVDAHDVNFYATRNATGTNRTDITAHSVLIAAMGVSTATNSGIIAALGVSTAANSSNAYYLGISTKTNADNISSNDTDIYNTSQTTGTLVKKAGDTMTGNLTVSSSAYVTGNLKVGGDFTGVVSGTMTDITATHYGDGSHLTGISGGGGGGADTLAREVTIGLGHAGDAFQTTYIDTYEVGAYDLFIDSISVSVDSAPVTTDLIYEIWASSPSGVTTFNSWHAVAGTITVSVGVKRSTTTTLGALYSTSRTLKAGSRVRLDVHQTGGASAPGGNDGRVNLNAHKP